MSIKLKKSVRQGGAQGKGKIVLCVKNLQNALKDFIFPDIPAIRQHNEKTNPYVFFILLCISFLLDNREQSP